MKPKVLVAVVVAAVVVGGGAIALTRFMAPSEDAAVSYVPADVIGYANVFIRPSNSQKQALDDLLRKFPGIDSTEEAIDRLIEQIDAGLEQEGMSYEEDVEPWLGDQVAVYFATGGTAELPNFAVLVESKDDAELEEFVDGVAAASEVALVEREYEGASYWMQEDGSEPIAAGVLEGFLAVGTEEAFKASVDANAGGDTLDEDREFRDAVEPLNDDWIGLVYLDTQAFVTEITKFQEGLGANDRAALDAFGLDEQRPQAGIVYATSDSVTFEGTGSFSPTGAFGDLADLASEPGVVPELPAETWAAYGIPSFGDVVGGLFDTFQNIPGFDRSQVDAVFYGQTGLRLEEDVLSWMDDAGLFVQGTSIQQIGGGLVVESSDPAKTTRVLEKLEELATQQGIPTRPETKGDLEGFSVQIPGVPAPFYALGGDRLVLAYGDAAATGAAGGSETLRDSEAFAAAQDAVGDDFNVSFFLDVDGAQAFGEALAGFTGAPMDVYEQDVKPYVDVLTHVVAAAKTEGDTVVQKLVVGVE